MKIKKTIQNTLLILSVLTIFYTYYYLPKKYSKIIKIEESPISLETKKEEKKNEKNTFFNTEYKHQNTKGKIYTTKSKESYIFQSHPDIIHLIEPHSFTTLEKDQTLIEIKSKTGLYDKAKKTTSYNGNVIIKNKNYIITANSAEHISEKNMIFIRQNIVMKDLTLGLSHIAYSDIIEINTITNEAVTYMNSKDKKVIAKKLK